MTAIVDSVLWRCYEADRRTSSFRTIREYIEVCQSKIVIISSNINCKVHDHRLRKQSITTYTYEAAYKPRRLSISARTSRGSVISYATYEGSDHSASHRMQALTGHHKVRGLYRLVPSHENIEVDVGGPVPWHMRVLPGQSTAGSQPPTRTLTKLTRLRSMSCLTGACKP